MSGFSAAPTPPISPAEMQVLVSRAGLTLNPGQMADLVLAWRQMVGLLGLIPRDRPLLDDQAFVFRLPPPAGAAESRAAQKPTSAKPVAKKSVTPAPRAAKKTVAAAPRAAKKPTVTPSRKAPSHTAPPRTASSTGKSRAAGKPAAAKRTAANKARRRR